MVWNSSEDRPLLAIIQDQKTCKILRPRGTMTGYDFDPVWSFTLPTASSILTLPNSSNDKLSSAILSCFAWSSGPQISPLKILPTSSEHLAASTSFMTAADQKLHGWFAFGIQNEIYVIRESDTISEYVAEMQPSSTMANVKHKFVKLTCINNLLPAEMIVTALSFSPNAPHILAASFSVSSRKSSGDGADIKQKTLGSRVVMWDLRIFPESLLAQVEVGYERIESLLFLDSNAYSEPYQILATFSSGGLVLLSLSDSLKQKDIVQTKAVSGLSILGRNTHCFLSYDTGFTGIVQLWDTRRLHHPTSMETGFTNGILHAACSKNGVIAVLGREIGKAAPFIRFWNISFVNVSVSPSNTLPLTLFCQSDFASPITSFHHCQNSVVKDLSLAPHINHCPSSSIPDNDVAQIAYFLWPNHKADLPQIVLVSDSYIFKLSTLSFDTGMSISSKNQILTTERTQLRSRIIHQSFEEDISHLILTRAMSGYGLYFSNAENDLVAGNCNQTVDFGGNVELASVWQWISNQRCLYVLGASKLFGQEYCFSGLLNLMSDVRDHIKSGLIKEPSTRSSRNVLSLSSSSSSSSSVIPFPFRVYISSFRRLGLAFLGHPWSAGTDSGSSANQSWNNVLSELERNGEFGRAAATAIFHAHSISMAVELLNASEDPALKMVAVAVLAFCSTPSASFPDMWSSTCKSASANLSDPYLIAILELLASNGDWKQVLAISSLPCTDKMGIALQFIPDQECLEYLQSQSDLMLQCGDLHGLLLVGLNQLGINNLLQSYVDRTGDVQTCALLSSLVVPRQCLSPVVDEWVSRYTMILNRWKLYRERAHFDIARHRLAHCHPFTLNEPKLDNDKFDRPGPVPYVERQIAAPVASQMVIRCTFCTESIVRIGDAGAGPSAVRSSIAATQCPHCRKPLSKCALCLMPTGSNLDPGSTSNSSPIAHWFTVCIKCQHGGHAEHLQDWFNDHDICPISDCDCICGEDRGQTRREYDTMLVADSWKGIKREK